MNGPTLTIPAAHGEATTNPLRLGVAGLGRAFTLMIPTWQGDPRVRLVAGFDPRAAARERFERDFGGTGQPSLDALCADPDVELIYIATPHQMHADHVCLAAQHGKHVLVEKPMAIRLNDCDRMVAACEQAGVQLLVGHSHSFDAPIRHAAGLIASGRHGAVRMIQAQYHTDFLYRPRRPEELQTGLGGGVVHNQAAHQMDIVRLLGGGEVATVRALTGAWDAERPTEGAYAALLTFQGGAFASLLYSGYAHFDSDEWHGWIGEMGRRKSPDDYGAARRRLASRESADHEAWLKAEGNFGGSRYQPPPTTAPYHQHFGHVLVSCDHADLRPTPEGVWVYANGQREFQPVPVPAVPRQEVVDELWAVLREGRPALHSGHWGRATTEACLALLESARLGTDVRLARQVPLPAPPSDPLP
ncbi:MAG: Gfo/Idh/MocA family oxidoreductase [Pigmentiphaga sp.]|nr:Gfo/Idh/MocA family oxidoreductase [Pigmentiphaga sp.]